MSALGQKQTFAVQKGMSALPPKADMCDATRDVRFVPKADIEPSLTACPGWLSRAVNGRSSRHLVGVQGPAAPAVAARRLGTKMPPITNANPAISAGVTGSPRNKLASRIATIRLSVRYMTTRDGGSQRSAQVKSEN